MQALENLMFEAEKIHTNSGIFYKIMYSEDFVV